MNLKFTNSTCLTMLGTTRGDKELARNRLVYQLSELNRTRNQLVYSYNKFNYLFLNFFDCTKY